MFKIGDTVEVVLKNDFRFKFGRRFVINKISKCHEKDLYMNTKISEVVGLFSEDIKLVESEENKMTKNFKQVIADIKKGEV